MPGWSWTYARADGSDVGPPPGDGRRMPPRQPAQGFPVQADAETWLGESWRQLLVAGVELVWLEHDGQRVYGPLALRPPA
jgi:hypothetical protein